MRKIVKLNLKDAPKDIDSPKHEASKAKEVFAKKTYGNDELIQHKIEGSDPFLEKLEKHKENYSLPLEGKKIFDSAALVDASEVKETFDFADFLGLEAYQSGKGNTS